MIPPEPQNFGFKFPASGSVPVLFSSMGLRGGRFKNGQAGNVCLQRMCIFNLFLLIITPISLELRNWNKVRLSH